MWGTDPFRVDTDEDGYIDQVDDRPLVDSRVPNVLVFSGSHVDRTDGDFNRNVTIRVSDHSEIESVSIRAHYDPLYGDPFTVSQPPQLLSQVEDGAYHVSMYNRSLDQHGVLDEPPEYYYVNATDAAGNRMAVKVDPNETVAVPEDADIEGIVSSPKRTGAAGAIVASAEVNVGAGGGAVGVVYSNPGTAAVVTIGLLVGAPALAYADYNQPAEGFESDVLSGPVGGVVPATGQPEVYAVDYAPFTIRLSPGAVYDAPGAIGERHDRGFGWEYIKRTPGIHERGDVEEILRTPDQVVNDGRVKYIIDQEDGILTIIEGTLLAASEQPAYNEECEDTININEYGNPEHSIRDGKPINKVSTLKEILQNPTRIVDAGGQRYYILRLGPNKVIMAVADTVSTGYHILRTILTGESGGFYRTVDDAMDSIPDKDKNVVYDEDNGINEC